jgi:RNA polymerase sigma-70 factor (ECF subfamily)
VGALPEELREIVDLLYYDGLTQEEAATLLGLSPRTLKRRWQTAKVYLHKKLHERSG